MRQESRLEGERRDACLSSQDPCLVKGWQLTRNSVKKQCGRNTVLLLHKLGRVTCHTERGRRIPEKLFSIEYISFNKIIISYSQQLNV